MDSRTDSNDVRAFPKQRGLLESSIREINKLVGAMLPTRRRQNRPFRTGGSERGTF